MDYGDERLPERFWAKVYPEPNSGCWLWGAATSRDGYGIVGRPRERGCFRAHRWVLETATGTTGEQARHQCGVRPCVNPDHLVWGTNSENQLDSVRHGTHQWARRTRCPAGHPYDEMNTLLRKNGKRICLTCKRAKDAVHARRYRANRRNTK